MRTTEVLIEHLTGGILITAAAVFCIWALCPQPLEAVLKGFVQHSIKNPWVVVVGSAVLGSVAYSVGLLAEYSARAVFEARLDKTKWQCLTEYVDAHQSLLANDPILGEYYGAAEPKIGIQTASGKYGQMRYAIMKLDSNLSRDVETQINRMRLIRVLFFVEALVGIGAIVRVVQNRNWSMLALAAAMALLLPLTRRAINYRFRMYCRAVGRSYYVLRLAVWQASVQTDYRPI